MPATILQDWEQDSAQLPTDATPAERDFFSRQWLAQRKAALAKLPLDQRRTVTAHVRGLPGMPNQPAPDAPAAPDGNVLAQQAKAQLAMNPLAHIGAAGNRLITGEASPEIEVRQDALPGTEGLGYAETPLPDPQTYGEALAQVPTQVMDVAKNVGNTAAALPSLLANPTTAAAFAVRTGATLLDPVNLIELTPAAKGLKAAELGGTALAEAVKEMMRYGAASAASEGLGGAVDSAAQQYAEKGAVSGPQLMRDTLTEAAVGGPFGLAGRAAGQGHAPAAPVKPPEDDSLTPEMTPELARIYENGDLDVLAEVFAKANPGGVPPAAPVPGAQPMPFNLRGEWAPPPPPAVATPTEGRVTQEQFRALDPKQQQEVAKASILGKIDLEPAPSALDQMLATPTGRGPLVGENVPGASLANTTPVATSDQKNRLEITTEQQQKVKDAQRQNAERVARAKADEKMAADVADLRKRIQAAGDAADLDKLSELSGELDFLLGNPIKVSPIENPAPVKGAEVRPSPWGAERAAEVTKRADEQIGRTAQMKQQRRRESIPQGPIGQDTRNYTPGGATTFDNPSYEGTAATTPPALMDRLAGVRKSLESASDDAVRAVVTRAAKAASKNPNVAAVRDAAIAELRTRGQAPAEAPAPAKPAGLTLEGRRRQPTSRPAGIAPAATPSRTGPSKATNEQLIRGHERLTTALSRQPGHAELTNARNELANELRTRGYTEAAGGWMGPPAGSDFKPLAPEEPVIDHRGDARYAVRQNGKRWIIWDNQEGKATSRWYGTREKAEDEVAKVNGALARRDEKKPAPAQATKSTSPDPDSPEGLRAEAERIGGTRSNWMRHVADLVERFGDDDVKAPRVREAIASVRRGDLETTKAIRDELRPELLEPSRRAEEQRKSKLGREAVPSPSDDLATEEQAIATALANLDDFDAALDEAAPPDQTADATEDERLLEMGKAAGDSARDRLAKLREEQAKRGGLRADEAGELRPEAFAQVLAIARDLAFEAVVNGYVEAKSWIAQMKKELGDEFVVVRDKMKDLYREALERRADAIKKIRAERAGGKMSDGPKKGQEASDGATGQVGADAPGVPAGVPADAPSEPQAGRDAAGPSPERGRDREGDDAQPGGLRGERPARRGDDSEGADHAGAGGDDAGRAKPAGRPARSAGKGGSGAVGVPRRPDGGVEAEASPAVTRNYRIPEDLDLGGATPLATSRANVAAIKVLRELQKEDRLPTADEARTLALFRGWGGAAHAFQPWSNYDNRKAWSDIHNELLTLLSPDEMKAASRSTQNAHYTSRAIIDAMYTALLDAGLGKLIAAGARPTILEPSIGTGNFIGMMPAGLSNVAGVRGVELDPITAAIAQKLYPDSAITEGGFEKTRLPRNYFDVAIGNPPFGDITLADKEFNPHGDYKIHDHFFVKALASVRPGGVLMFITSTGTMNSSKSAKARAEIAKQADLVAAVRIPGGAFKDNAGTEVTTDLIVLRKRADGEQPDGPVWQNTVPHELPSGQTYPLNEYFANHPEMALGKHVADKLYGSGGRLALEADGRDIGKAIANALAEKLPADLIKRAERKQKEKPDPEVLAPSSGNVKNFAYVVHNGKLAQSVNGQIVAVELPKEDVAIVKDLIAIRDLARDLVHAQMKGDDDLAIARIQKGLNAVYDKFVKANGPINQTKVRGSKKEGKEGRRSYLELVADDPDLTLLQALENYTEATNRATKSDMFTRRTISYQAPIRQAGSASDALTASLAEHGKVNLPWMANVTGKSEEAIIEELGDTIYHNPESDDDAGGWETATAYLAGNVRAKLAAAEEAAKTSSQYKRNVAALERVIPEDVSLVDAEVRLGAAWVPTDVVANFINETLKAPEYAAVTVSRDHRNNTWKIHTPERNTSIRALRTNTHTFAGGDMTFLDLVDDIMNLRQIRVMDPGDRAAGIPPRLNKAKTDEAKAMARQIKQSFRDWLVADDKRLVAMTRIYNDTNNNTVLREDDGSHLTFPGMSPAVKLNKWQKDAVWRILQDRRALLAHVVGAGKTYTMIAAAMEMRRTGVAKKPLLVVPNSMLRQWSNDFARLYPGAKVAAVTDADLKTPDARKRFMARISTNDWDAVIITHANLKKIDNDPNTVREIVEERRAELLEAMQDARASGAPRQQIKRMENELENLENKMLRDEESKQNTAVFTFPELGVDFLFVDEAHLFKNPGYSSKMGGVLGVGSSGGAAMARDLETKTRHIQAVQRGDGVVFATGTPVTNTMGELYAMMRYLQRDVMKAAGLHSFDAWAAAYGEEVTQYEIDMKSDKMIERTRFARFFNLPELITLFRKVADIRMADDIDLAVPELETGGLITIASEPSAELIAYSEDLQVRAENLRGKPPSKGQPTVPNLLNWGKRAAIDMRFVNPDAAEDPNGKIAKAVENVLAIYREGTGVTLEGAEGKVNTTQVIFLDNGPPSATKRKKATNEPEPEATEEVASDVEGGIDFGSSMDSQLGIDDYTGSFQPYEVIKQKLIAGGVPAEAIASIYDYDKPEQKQQLFDAMNRGEVRILLGSTSKMGAGVNIQRLLVAMHHLDAPVRPADFEQRIGRIVRQGNLNKQVKVFAYITKRSLDADAFVRLLRKQGFINQVLRGKAGVREMEDVSEDAMNFRALATAAADNPLFEEFNKNEQRLVELEASARLHKRRQADARLSSASLPDTIASYKRNLQAIEADRRYAEERTPDPFVAKIGGKDVAYDQLGEAIPDQVAEYVKALTKDEASRLPWAADIPVGEMMGWRVSAMVHNATSSGRRVNEAYIRSKASGTLYPLRKNMVKSIESAIENGKRAIERTENDLAAARAIIGEKFKDADELARLSARQKEIERLMSGKPEEGPKVALPDGVEPIANLTMPRKIAAAAFPNSVTGNKWVVGTLAGQAAYSNGHYALVGAHPEKPEGLATQDVGTRLDEIAASTDGAKPVAPIGFMKFGDSPDQFVLFDNGAVVDGGIYAHIMKSAPTAKFLAVPDMNELPIRIEADGKLAGVVMPQRFHRGPIFDAQQAIKAGGNAPSSDVVDGWLDTLESKADELVADADSLMRKRGYRSNTGLDNEAIAAASKYGAALFLRGVVGFGRWSKALAKKFGDAVLEERTLLKVWQQASKHLSEDATFQEMLPHAWDYLMSQRPQQPRYSPIDDLTHDFWHGASFGFNAKMLKAVQSLRRRVEEPTINYDTDDRIYHRAMLDWIDRVIMLDAAARGGKEWTRADIARPVTEALPVNAVVAAVAKKIEAMVKDVPDEKESLWRRMAAKMQPQGRRGSLDLGKGRDRYAAREGDPDAALVEEMTGFIEERAARGVTQDDAWKEWYAKRDADGGLYRVEPRLFASIYVGELRGNEPGKLVVAPRSPESQAKYPVLPEHVWTVGGDWTLRDHLAEDEIPNYKRLVKQLRSEASLSQEHAETIALRSWFIAKADMWRDDTGTPQDAAQAFIELASDPARNAPWMDKALVARAADAVRSGYGPYDAVMMAAAGRGQLKSFAARLVKEEDGFLKPAAILDWLAGKKAPTTPAAIAPPAATPLSLYGETQVKQEVGGAQRKLDKLIDALVDADRRGVPLDKRLAIALQIGDLRAELAEKHGAATLTRAKAENVAAAITPGYDQAHPGTTPTYDGAKYVLPAGINFWRLDVDQEVKDFFQGVLDGHEPQFHFLAGTKKRGHEQVWTEAIADLAAGRWGVKQILERDENQGFNDKQMTASRVVMATIAHQARELSRSLNEDALTPEQRDIKRASLARGVELLAVVSAQTEGATKAVARALAAHRIMASADDKVGRQIKRMLVSDLNGIDELAKVIHQIDDLDALTLAAKAEVMKDGWTNKIAEWWLMAILSAPITHMRNVFGNAFNVVGTLAEEAIAAAGGNVGWDEVQAQSAALLSSIPLAWNTAVTSFAMNAPQSGTTQIDGFEGAIGGKAGEVVRTPGRFLMAEDEFFKVLAYQMSLAQQATVQARKEGLAGKAKADRVAELVAGDDEIFSEDFHDRAVEEANYRTFQQKMGDFAGGLLRAKRRWPALAFLIPFVKTPVNIVKYAGERSVLAPISKQVRDEIAAGGARRDRAIAKMALGTAVMTGALALALAGGLTGAGPSDPEDKQTLMATGWRPYSIKVGDYYLPFNQATGALAMLLGSVADVAERWNYNQTDRDRLNASDREKLLDTVVMGALVAARGNLLEQTFWRGVHDFTDATYSPERYGSKLVANLVSGFIPNVLGKVADAADPYYRDTRGADVIDTTVRTAQAKIPVLGQALPPRLDLTGKPVERNAYSRQVGLTGLPFPAYPGVDKHDKLLSEMVRLGENASKTPRTLTVRGHKVPLDSEMHHEFVRLKGEMFDKLVRRLVEGDRWDALSEERQRAVFEKVRARASTAATHKFIKLHRDVVRAALRSGR